MTRLIRQPEVLRQVGFKRTKLQLLIRDGEFPKPKTIKGCVVWNEADVQRWIQQQWEAAS